MIKALAMILIALSFFFNGCATKERLVTKIEYIKEPKYQFNKIELQGAYIELKDKETQRVCTQSLIELNTIYKGVIEFYDWQIDNYKEDGNETRQ